MTDIVNDLVEVTLPTEEDFLKIKETLTRIGIASRKENKLYQSCHILHKQGKYYIVHFKEMFLLDGRQSDFSEEDRVRRNIVIKRLEEWGLVNVVDPSKIENGTKTAYVKVIPYKDKSNWELVVKYNVGKFKSKDR